ncbi:hypothetical protein C0995_009368 [Termitomyces sp. Mi166|nr:hypothetical protein C0995_009368 [Termitomyces sp. Mi166\
MSGLLLTIDDTSPLITYQPPNAWAQRNISTDPDAASQSYKETFTSTQQPGATMTFTFEGVGVSVYGSVDVDHGNFTVDLDGRNIPKQVTGPLAYQVALANYTLSPGTHTLTISTKGNSTFVFDYLTWVSSVNVEKTGSVNGSVVDDADPAFEKRQGDWLKPSDVADFFDSTGRSRIEVHHFLSTSQVNERDRSKNGLRIYGDAVALYGSVGPDNGPYSIQLDNGTSKDYSANTKTYTAQSLLYYGSNIGPGNHSLTIINQANDLFEIDYAVKKAIDVSTPTPTRPFSLSAGVIVGITVGAGAAVILVSLICFLFYLRRIKEKWAREQDQYAKSRFAYDTLSPGGLEDSTWVGARFRRNSKSTIGSPESPGKSEMHKTFVSYSVPTIQIPAPTLRSNASVASTLVEDGSNASVSHMSYNTHRPKRKYRLTLGHLHKLKHTGSVKPTYTDRIFPQPSPGQLAHAHGTVHAQHHPMPIGLISESQEVGPTRRHRSDVLSQSSRGVTPIQESEYDASSETDSVYSTRPGPPPPSLEN